MAKAARLPGETRYRDIGCEVAPRCLECFLPQCKHDDPGRLRSMTPGMRSADEQAQERLRTFGTMPGETTGCRGMKAALYLRVSTIDQGQEPQVQESPLREWAERLGYEPAVYAEFGVSGAKTRRPALDRLIRAVRRREVQAVMVLKLDRLGRSLSHLLQLLGEFEANGVRLLIHDSALDTGTPQGKLFFEIMGAFAEYERSLIAERVKHGLHYARAHGTRSGRDIGRPRAAIDFRIVLDTISGPESRTVAAQARRLGISRATLYRIMGAAGYRWEEEVGWASKTPSRKDGLSA